jgi:DNA-binding response OmpR family regulator
MPKRLLKILVVEDSVDQVESLEMLLHAAGYVCYSAIGTQAGIAKCKVHPPDVVVLDWVMPPSGGIVFLEWFRSQQQFRETPVLIVTGLDVTDVPGLHPEATTVMFKPYKPEAMIEFLDRCCAGKGKP